MGLALAGSGSIRHSQVAQACKVVPHWGLQCDRVAAVLKDFPSRANRNPFPLQSSLLSSTQSICYTTDSYPAHVTIRAALLSLHKASEPRSGMTRMPMPIFLSSIVWSVWGLLPLATPSCRAPLTDLGVRVSSTTKIGRMSTHPQKGTSQSKRGVTGIIRSRGGTHTGTDWALGRWVQLRGSRTSFPLPRREWVYQDWSLIQHSLLDSLQSVVSKAWTEPFGKSPRLCPKVSERKWGFQSKQLHSVPPSPPQPKKRMIWL